jgi:hypothetical protein
MDDDYSAGIRCKRGQISRKAHYRTLKRGKHLYVKSKCIKDRGAPGRWQSVKHSIGIGPLKTGSLAVVGYHGNDSTTQRHEALTKAVKRYGKQTTMRKLRAVATYTKRTAPTRSRTYRKDTKWIGKTM